jgi:hypothetical protein
MDGSADGGAEDAAKPIGDDCGTSADGELAKATKLDPAAAADPTTSWPASKRRQKGASMTRRRKDRDALRSRSAAESVPQASGAGRRPAPLWAKAPQIAVQQALMATNSCTRCTMPPATVRVKYQVC